MESVEKYLASLVANVHWNQLPESTKKEAVRAVLDYLAAAIAGYRFGEIRPALSKVVSDSVSGEATLVGNNKRASLSDAVFFNGTLGHAVEMDDGVRAGSVHIGTVVVPTALALGAQRKSSGEEVLEAIVAGYEVMVRIAVAIAPSHTVRGFHTTGYCGPFGAAAAASKLLKLSENDIHGALGTAGLLGAGLLEVNRSGQLMKPLHPGRAAEAGLLAARLAAAGAGGPLQILSGPRGFGQAVAEAVDWDRIVKGNPNLPWEIDGRYIKLYPTCRHIHVAIDLGLKLHRERHPKVDDIRSIDIATYYNAVRETGSIKAPDNAAAGRFSMAYCVASAILRGSLTNEDLEIESLRDQNVLNLAKCVDVSLGSEHQERYPQERATSMRIKSANGDLLTLEGSFPKGEQENPLTDEELDEKFRQCCGRAVAATRVDKLIQVVRGLPKAPICPDLPALCVVS